MELQSEAGNGAASPGWFDAALHWISLVIEATGVAVIVLGTVVAIAVFLRCLARGGEWSGTYHTFRTSLARAILLGLEFLVAADIIGTVAVEPTLQNLSVLGLIVLIRTFLSFALQLEISGRWPWQKAPHDSRQGGSQRE
jgi:uncharacterized membrane protein